MSREEKSRVSKGKSFLSYPFSGCFLTIHSDFHKRADFSSLNGVDVFKVIAVQSDTLVQFHHDKSNSPEGDLYVNCWLVFSCLSAFCFFSLHLCHGLTICPPNLGGQSPESYMNGTKEWKQSNYSAYRWDLCTVIRSD